MQCIRTLYNSKLRILFPNYFQLVDSIGAKQWSHTFCEWSTHFLLWFWFSIYNLKELWWFLIQIWQHALTVTHLNECSSASSIFICMFLFWKLVQFEALFDLFVYLILTQHGYKTGIRENWIEGSIKKSRIKIFNRLF